MPKDIDPKLKKIIEENPILIKSCKNLVYGQEEILVAKALQQLNWVDRKSLDKQELLQLQNAMMDIKDKEVDEAGAEEQQLHKLTPF